MVRPVLCSLPRTVEAQFWGLIRTGLTGGRASGCRVGGLAVPEQARDV